MVFGNLGDDCATGVAFTRDPSTGERGIYGEFLPNAQGEDVVAGMRTPARNQPGGRASMGKGNMRSKRPNALSISRRSKSDFPRFTKSC